jgi:homoserine dehydrogenase
LDIRLALTGFGNVGQGLATLLDRYGDTYLKRYGVALRLSGVADRAGAAVSLAGLDPVSLLEAKEQAGTVSAHSSGVPGLHGSDFLDRAQAHILVEAASTNFDDAEPGWSYVCGALERKMDVVLASKGSLALHFRELMENASRRGLQVQYSATVGAPVPSLQIADRALIGSEILAFEGILNGTTHQVLTAMTQGSSYDEGVRQAQEMGIAETDPTLDVDGWDAAAKVAIVANSVFGADLRIGDVDRVGIRGVTAAELAQARESGEAIKLIARAERTEAGVTAWVRPERRPLDDPLGRLRGDAMGIVFFTRPLGAIAATVDPSGESGGISTAMTVLRDVLNLARDRGWTEPHQT